MKKFFALSLLLTGMLFFCACEKDMIEPDPQSRDISALKAAKKHTVPFKASFVQTQTYMEGVPPLIYVELEGLGNASHLGRTRLWVGQIWDMGDFSGPAEGAADVIFTAANGDELHADLYAYNAVELDRDGNPVFATVWGSGTFVNGGSGRFEKASGSYELTAYYDFVTGESEAWYKGEIMH